MINPFKKRIKTEPLELYDTPERISVKVFYKIMETNDLLLLAVNPSQLKQSDAELLNDIWLEHLDYYYRNTNRQHWENFLRNLKNVAKIQNEITSCKAAYEMCLLYDDRGYEYLKQFGIKSSDLSAVRSAIMAKETKLEFAENKLQKNDEKEVFKFYKILVSVKNAVKRELDIDRMCLAEWVETLSNIQEQNKMEQEAMNKTKNRR